MEKLSKSFQYALIKGIGYGLGIFVLLGLLIIQALPFVMLQLAKYEFSEQGKDYSLQVADWHWSPWRGELELLQLALRHPSANELAFSDETKVASFYIQFDPWKLIKGQVQVNDVSVTGLQLALNVKNLTNHENQPSLAVLGLNIPLAQSTNNSASAQPTMPIGINSISIVDSQLNWQQAASDGQGAHGGKLVLTNMQFGPYDNQHSQDMQVAATFWLNEFILENNRNIESNIRLQQPLALQLNGVLLNVNDQPNWQGDVSIAQLDVQLADQTQLLLAKFNLTELAIKLNDEKQLSVMVKNLLLDGLSIKRNHHALISVGKYQVSDVHYGPLIFSTGDMAYEQLHVDVKRLNDGSVEGLTPIPKPDQATQAAKNSPDLIDATNSDSQATVSATNFVIDIASLLQKADSSVIRLKDDSIVPAYTGNLQIKKIAILPVKINTQGQAIPMEITAVFSLDEYNEFNIQAQLSLQAQKNGDWYPQGEIQFQVDQLDMVPFNGYLAKAMGYHLEKGMLKLSGKVAIEQAKLKGEVDILLRNSRFVPEDEAIIASMSKKISMPVDMALDLLRDSNGNVKLNIPISGDLSNPDFGAGNLSAQISQLVLQNAALHYLKLSLQPYGLFLSLAAYAGNELMAIRLDALNYTAFEFELTEQHKEKLKNISEIMTKKTRLELQVCPFSSDIEVQELADKWQDLATKRGAKIKAWLADQKDQDDNPLSQRITLCKPQKSSKTEVVLGFN